MLFDRYDRAILRIWLAKQLIALARWVFPKPGGIITAFVPRYTEENLKIQEKPNAESSPAKFH